MNWYDALKTLVKAVAEGKSGEVGFLKISPPDPRVRVELHAGPDYVGLLPPNGPIKVFPDKSDEAVDAYVAAVEGSS